MNLTTVINQVENSEYRELLKAMRMEAMVQLGWECKDFGDDFNNYLKQKTFNHLALELGKGLTLKMIDAQLKATDQINRTMKIYARRIDEITIAKMKEFVSQKI